MLIVSDKKLNAEDIYNSPERDWVMASQDSQRYHNMVEIQVHHTYP
jgi:hypothetical protein